MVVKNRKEPNIDTVKLNTNTEVYRQKRDTHRHRKRDLGGEESEYF